jgi:predicted TIM-barrel fold metal-dependent hydrolase
MQLGYRVVDLDNHYYEPNDCFSRHIDPRFVDRAVNVRPSPRGLGQVFLGDRRLGYQSVTQTDFIGAPGSLRDYFTGAADKPIRSGGDDDAPSGTIGNIVDVVYPREIPAFMGREARLALMDEQEVEAALMLPTLGVCVEHELGDDPASAVANIRAFNRWLEDDWGYAFRGRIFGAPLVTLLDVDFAVEEVQRVAELGARAVVLKVGPVQGRSPADPSFDPFWQAVVEARLPVVLHVGDSGYCELISAHWGEQPRPPIQRYTAFQVFTSFMEMPISDTIAALILHNLFVRFPGLKVLSIENGASWVPWLLKRMDKAWRSAKGRTGLGGEVTERPSDVFRRHVYVSPFPEDDITGLAGLIGIDNVLFGSDFPHPEGMEAPASFADELVGFDDVQIRRIMRDNGAELLGLTRDSAR